MDRFKTRHIETMVLAMVTAIVLSACQTVPVAVPKVETKTPVEIADAAKLAPVGFDRIGIKVRRGELIGAYEPDLFGFTDCYGQGGKIYWHQGRVMSRDVEFADIFFDTMKNANFNVVGNPDKLFASATANAAKPRFLVGGQIDEIKLNACQKKDFWTRLPRQEVRGKGAVRVRWQVFDVFERKVVFETVTRGAAELEKGLPGGELILVQNAFGNAVNNLAAEPELAALLSARQDTIADVRKVEDVTLEIPRFPTWTKPIADNIDDIRLSVVTIDNGSGHGSGFFITPTLIMTNHHVIDGQNFVRIELLTGRKTVGEVLRSHRKRDVALVKVENSGYRPIPIRTSPVKVTEDVYAIGSPLLKQLKGTVSKGVVSKFKGNTYGLEDIQADVDIHGGNSGGALVDGNGNVVGVSYAGYGGQTSVGLNLFVPIMDAMRYLNVEFRKPATGS
jgi:serine protease Do